MIKKTKVDQNEKVAIIWSRTSAKEPAEREKSLEMQKKACREYARQHNIRVINHYANDDERAEVGCELFKVVAMQVAANDNEVNTILVSSFDRCSRVKNETIDIRQYLKPFGISIISVNQPT